MDNRLQIDNSIDEKSSDFYYSATDMYGVDLFTNHFRSKEIQIQTEYEERMDYVQSNLFINSEKNETYSEFSSMMFMTKGYESKYNVSSNVSVFFIQFAMCMLSAMVSLSVCFFLTNKKKKVQKK